MSVSARSVTDHNPSSDEHTNVIVYVNGTRIPVGDVDVFMRKEGPLDFTRYAEGAFPSPYKGTHYANAFSGFTPADQESWDVVTIDVKDHVTEDFYRTFHGVVTGVGNAADGGDRWMAFRAQGPGHFLDKIPANYTANDAKVSDVMGYVTNQLNDHLPFDVALPSVMKTQVRDSTTVESPPTLPRVPSTWVTSRIAQFMSLSEKYDTEKSWHFGKDTLADVVEWAREKGEFYTWIGNSKDGVGFVTLSKPTTTEHKATYSGGQTKIGNNDALAELRPVNTMLVKAPAKESRDGERNKASKQFVKAKAVHEGLYRRTGGTHLYADVHHMSDAVTKKEAENEARKKLKEKINTAREGDMQTLLRGPVTPFDTIEAKPTCEGSAATDAPSITYEVNRVHHEVTADEIPETKLNVGVHVDTGDITVLDSWEKSP